MGFKSLYEKNYKKLLIIPTILFILSIGFLITKHTSEGFFIDRDFSIKGGVSATISTNIEVNKEILISNLQSEFPNSDITIRQLTQLSTGSSSGIIIEVTEISKEDLQPTLQTEFPNSDISIQEVSSSLGASFFRQMVTALIFAFILMGIVVFITFRKFIPSIAIILSALLDIIIPLAIISFLNIKLSTAGLAAFLLVIGYSIDTDILLTTRLLKRKQDPLTTRLLHAFKTGMTMTLTTLAALIVALILAWNIPILKQMFSILTIALIIDIISTWLMNAPILIWYLKKNENK